MSFPIKNTLSIAAREGRAMFVFINAKEHVRQYIRNSTC